MTLLFPLGEPADPAERDLLVMDRGLALAQFAAEDGEVPVGALVVRDGRILGRGWNQVEQLKDSTAHAEMVALTQAFATAGEKRLLGAEVWCTLEPCLQCAGALIHARVRRVIWGAADPKFGGVVSLATLFDLPGINHKVEHIGGIRAQESAELLQTFFRNRRG